MSHDSSRARLTLVTFHDLNLSSGFAAGFISELIQAFESGSREKLLHSARVAVIANNLGRDLQLPYHVLKELFFASMLHDIGGITMQSHISEHLTEIPDLFGQKTDFHVFSHPTRSHFILNRFPTFRKIADVVYAHHEFFDGSGFPRGLKGEKIPQLSRIIRIADTVDIIMRIHDIKDAEDLDTFLRIASGEEFDPELYETFITMLKRNNLIAELKDPEQMDKLFEDIKLHMKDQYYLSATDTLNRFFETIAVLIDNVTTHDKMHTLRVAEFAEQIALQMKLEQNLVLHVRWASFLHDLGKVSADRTLYTKPEKLNEEEWKIIRAHPQRSYDILNNVSGLQEISFYILHHHENYDGSGYPEGLSGEKIPMISRILRVADAFEAMTSERIYHRKRDWQMALKELAQNAGKQFDPKVVEATIKCFETK